MNEDLLSYFVRRIDSDMRNRFPGLASNEFDEVLESSLEEWSRDVSERCPTLDTPSFDIPECPSHEIIEGMVRAMKRIRPSADDSGWMRRCVFEGDNTELAAELQAELQAVLPGGQYDAEQAFLKAEAAKLIKSLSGIMEMMAEIEPDCRGMMWGNEPESFSGSQRFDVSRYSRVFRDNGEVRRFTDMLGRKDPDTASESGIFTGFDGNVKDDRMGTEIMGLELGRDLEKAVPSEFTMMMDDDLSIIFDMRFAEGRLLSFSREDEVSSMKDQSGELDAPESLGPIILIVDTSGSMGGSPLFMSKALCFTIATRAALQNRDVLRIDFNVNSRCVDMSPRKSMGELLEFLRTDACGGTDPSSALQTAVRRIEDERYSFADVVVFSDFMLDMSRFDPDSPDIRSMRDRGCRIHSVCIPIQYAVGDDCFDSSWGISRLNNGIKSGMFREITAGSRKRHRRMRRRSGGRTSVTNASSYPSPVISVS